MSIDLDWSQLDDQLSTRCLQGINEALKNGNKPAFLGDITATSFSFGRVSPVLEIVEIRDVFEEFSNVEDDDDDEDEEDYDEDYDHDMIHRRASGATDSIYSSASMNPASPATSQAGYPSSTTSRPLTTPGLYAPQAGLYMSHRSNSTNGHEPHSNPAFLPHLPFGHPHHHHASLHPNDNGIRQDINKNDNNDKSNHLHPHQPPETAEGTHQPPTSDPTADISLQLHFNIKYLGNMSISLSTTLKVNYPSPSFMSLPLNLKITGLAFEGLLVVAYEGDKKRLHVSILDEAEPNNRNKVVKGHHLLKHAFVESEVGQADKLVLKDVAKVEQFVLEMARKALQVSILFCSSFALLFFMLRCIGNDEY
jgi:distribution and morphology protein 12